MPITHKRTVIQVKGSGEFTLSFCEDAAGFFTLVHLKAEDNQEKKNEVDRGTWRDLAAERYRGHINRVQKIADLRSKGD